MSTTEPKNTHILCILDGFGLSSAIEGNPTMVAKLPNLKRVLKTYPWTTLNADGDAVGQESGLVGNSEVGHMNLGGLQLVKQLSHQITQSSFNGFDYNPTEYPDQLFRPSSALEQFWNSQDSSTRTVHLIGLFSTGTIHSDMRHWVGAIESAGKAGAENIILHLISDGRDSDRQSLVATWEKFVTVYGERLKPFENKIYLGSLGGRFYAMDRDNNWQRILIALSSLLDLSTYSNVLQYFNQKYDVEFNKQNLSQNDNKEESQPINFPQIGLFLKIIAGTSYNEGHFDENITPLGFDYIQTGHSVWLLNFRSDRMKQLTTALCDMNQEFGLGLNILAMNDYGIGKERLITQDDITLTDELFKWSRTGRSVVSGEAEVAEFGTNEMTLSPNDSGYLPIFKTRTVENTLAQYIEQQGKTQLHIAETEKYAHVTYFFDGGKEEKQTGEEWVVIPSNKVNNHAEKPEMKAVEVTDYILENGLGKFDYIIVNYANADMVGHTGDFEASVKSLEILDQQLGRLLENVEKNGYTLIITADHGNIERVGEYDNTGSIDTEHNANPVPLVVVNKLYTKSEIVEFITDFVKTNEFLIDPQALNDTFILDNRSLVDNESLNDLRSIPKPQLPLWFAGVVLVAFP